MLYVIIIVVALVAVKHWGEWGDNKKEIDKTIVDDSRK